jgi:hypothetical protein
MAFGRFSGGEGIPTKKFHIEPPARYREWDPADFDALKAKVQPGTVWQYAESGTGEKKEIEVLGVNGSNVSFTYKAILDRNKAKPEGERRSRAELLEGRTYGHTLYDFLEYANLEETADVEMETNESTDAVEPAESVESLPIASEPLPEVLSEPVETRTEHQIRDASILEAVRVRTEERLAAKEAELSGSKRGLFGSLHSWFGGKASKAGGAEADAHANTATANGRSPRKRFLAGLGLGAAIASLFSSSDTQPSRSEPARTEAVQPRQESEVSNIRESVSPKVEGRLEKGDGANELLFELRQGLMDEYGEELHDVPASVLRFLQGSMNNWSREFGFVTEEGSVLVHPGATLSFNDSNELVFADAGDNERIVLMNSDGTVNSTGVGSVRSMRHASK